MSVKIYFWYVKEKSPQDVSFRHPKYIFDGIKNDNVYFLELYVFVSTALLF